MSGVPLNIDWQQILLHLFNFTILFGALYILLYKPVKDFMAKREAQYADMDKGAETKLAEAEKSRAEYEEKLNNFDEDMNEEKARISKEIEAQRNEQLAEAKKDAEKIIAEAHVKAEKERNEIVASAQEEIANMVTDAMEKLTLDQTTSDAFDQFLDAAETDNK